MIDVPGLLTALQIPVAKRAGRRLWSVCPNPEHPDRDPSWFIWDDPDNQHHGRHRCYGCGWRGGPAELARVVLGIDWEEALDWLQTGDLVSTPLAVNLEIRERAIATAVKPPDWVQFDDPWPALATRYLTARGFDDATIRRWGLGYITKGIEAGRIWIPIRSYSGRLVSWQARSYVGSDLRYSSPDRCRTPVFYGAEHWPDPEDRRVVVTVEGPIDAWAVDRATRLPVAAIIGSNPSPTQLSSLATFQTVVALTDADPAGDKAAADLQGLSRWTQVVRARLRDGCDPGGSDDSTLRAALAAWYH